MACDERDTIMKAEVVIGAIFPHEVDTSLYRALVRNFPEGKEPRGFRFRVAESDPRCAKVLDMLHAAGLHPWKDHTRKPTQREFSFRIERIYDRTDWEAAEYLQPCSETCIRDIEIRNKEGLLELIPDFLRRKPQIGLAGAGNLVVSEAIRDLLGQAKFKHLVFRPTVLVAEDPTDFPVNYWEVTSDFILPPLSPTCVLVDGDGKPWSGDLNKLCLINEGPYMPPELHYRREDLQSVEPFDAGITRESLVRRGQGDLIVAKRFYEVCKKHKLRLKWWPVRVDP
jgi:hypothetical protein